MAAGAFALPLLLLLLALQATPQGASNSNHSGEIPLRRLLQDESALDLNPCKPQTLIAGAQYALGDLSWREGTILSWATEDSGIHTLADLGIGSKDSQWFSTAPWYLRSSFHRSPCGVGFSSELLDAGAKVALYESQVDAFQVFKTVPSNDTLTWLIEDQAAVLNGTLEYCCFDTTAVYSSQSTAPPIYSRRLDPNSYQDAGSQSGGVYLPNGVAVMNPVLIHSNFYSFSSDAEYLHPVVIDADNRTQTVECKLCQGWSSDLFLSDMGFNSSKVDTASLNFTCFLNTTCAWGPLLCETCLSGIYSGNSMPDWFSGFAQSEYQDGSNMTAGDLTLAQRRACDTFCSTFHYVWYTGIDAQGQYLTVGRTMQTVLEEAPFMALSVFQDLFGLSTELLESFKNVSLV